MKRRDILYDLYHGNIHPADMNIRNESNLAATLEAFTEQECWLKERISDDNKARLDELVSCHKRIVDSMSYENFRYGFQLGVMMMEAVRRESEVLFEL